MLPCGHKLLSRVSFADGFVLRNFCASAASVTENSAAVKPTRRHDTKKKTFPNPLNIFEAVGQMKKVAWASFPESVDVAIKLGVDPRKQNQSVRGVASLPHGNGKVVRVAVFASGADADAAIAAGADVVGGADLVTRVQGGDVPFDRVIATPEMMPLISKIGKVDYDIKRPCLTVQSAHILMYCAL